MEHGCYRLTSIRTGDGGRSFPANPPSDVGAMIRECSHELLIDGHVWHGACYLVFLALKTGRATIDETVGDYGLLHELAHAGSIGLGTSPCAAQTLEDLALLADRLYSRFDDLQGLSLQKQREVLAEAILTRGLT